MPMPERQFMKKLGYDQIVDRRRNQVSYVRLFGSTHYPRFHCYVDSRDTGFQINLHIDQKAPSYGSNTAHSGEYDGPVVEREGNRMQTIVSSMLGISGPTQAPSPDKGYNLMNFG